MSFKTSSHPSGKCSYSEKNKQNGEKLTMSSHHDSPFSSAYPHDEYDFDDENDEDLDEDRENDEQEESDEGI
jgi:hypothetical protein